MKKQVYWRFSKLLSDFCVCGTAEVDVLCYFFELYMFLVAFIVQN